MNAMSAIIFRLDDATLDRLTGLAATYGCDVQTVITRLLERDPHALESPLFA